MLIDSLVEILEMLPNLDVWECVVVGDAIMLPSKNIRDKPIEKQKSATICSKRGVFIYHSADRLIGQGFAGLICKEMLTALDFCLKIVLVFFQDVNNGSIS